MENIFTAVLGERSLEVTKFTREGIHFSGSIGEVGQTVSFLFCANANGIALELPVSGKVEPTPSGCVVPVKFNSAQSSAIRTLFNVGENSDPQDIVKILYKANTTTPSVVKTTQLFSMGMTAAVCLVLMGLVSYVQSAKQNSVSAQAAFIATDALVLESSSSGLVEYLAESGAIKTGEVYAAVRTRSGRSVFLESSAAGTIQNAGAQAGRSIVKGNPLVYVSNPSDRLFVKAYVNTATAARLPNGYSAEIKIGDGTVARVVTAATITATDITRDFQFTDQTGNPLSEVILPLQDFSGLAPGQTVQVRFINHAAGIFGFPAHQFGKMLQGWTNGSGTHS
jgi:hypothetical protein